MDMKMELSNENSATVTKLNTKGCCFLCLKSRSIESSNDSENIERKSVSIAYLLHHLQNEESNSAETVFGTLLASSEKIEAELCESCETAVTSFSILCQQLEKVQMEMNYFLERIHQCISESAKAPEQVQIYSKRMTSDPEALSQLAFVDNLRKEVAIKSLTRQKKLPRSRVELEKLQDPVKEEPQEFQELPIDAVFNNETSSSDPLHAPSPPPSEGTESLEFKYEFGNSPIIFGDGGENLSRTSPSRATSAAINKKLPSSSTKTRKQKKKANPLKRMQKKNEDEKTIARRQLSKVLEFRGDATIPCEVCGSLVKWRRNLASHLRKVHLQEYIVKCPYLQCKFSSPYKHSLPRHLKICSFNTQKENN